MISISVVSHGQGDLVGNLLADISGRIDPGDVELILTKNIPERLPFSAGDFAYSVKIVENASPKGFGANHNTAFNLATGEWFCVINPDIRIEADPFPQMLSCLADISVGLVGPRVLAPSGTPEDSARHFPTPLSLLAKMLGLSDGRYTVPDDVLCLPVDWVAGMFMLVRAEDFRRVCGFDDGFFLYYEDVDICARLWKSGRKVLLCPGAWVFHDARRTSRRNFRYMRWHLASMLRFFRKHFGRLPSSKATST